MKFALTLSNTQKSENTKTKIRRFKRMDFKSITLAKILKIQYAIGECLFYYITYNAYIK